MRLSATRPPSARPAALPDDPTTMPMPNEPVAWRRWADAMPDICLWIAPHSGRIVDCNRALFGVLGFSRQEVFGWPLQALAEPRNLSQAAATWRSLAACRTLRDADCTLRAREGFEVAVSATASPVLNDEGKVVAGLVVLRDITERRRREQTLQARKRQLKTLAYELAATEARERQRLGERLLAEAGPLLKAARDGLLALGKPGDAVQAQRIGELDALLGRVLQTQRDTADDLALPLLRTRGLQAAIDHLAQGLTREGGLVARVEGAVPDTLDIPEAVQATLFRVLRELATNASRHAHARHLWLRIQAEPERLGIVIGDDGCGFDMARLSTEPAAGGGIGLFAADARMQAIGGRLVVQSKPGRGTRAILMLPLMAAPAAQDTR
ncbi:ATP-binding protein [Aquabacterium sp.]|uniref:PAS domain-containing sensor histidine kinase n=1 Tax=Aquabacterium sp. TaxID=1872578 RepID=UPI0037849B80